MRSDEEVLEVIEIGAELKPLSRITGHMMRGEKSSNNSRNLGAMLKKPIPLEDARRGSGKRRFGGVFGGRRGEEKGDLGEVGEGEGVDRRLLGEEVIGDGGVKVGASDEGNQPHRWSLELFRIILHSSSPSSSSSLYSLTTHNSQPILMTTLIKLPANNGSIQERGSKVEESHI